MLLTYDIMQKVPSKAIQKELQIEQNTACDWFQFCREVVRSVTRISIPWWCK